MRFLVDNAITKSLTLMVQFYAIYHRLRYIRYRHIRYIHSFDNRPFNHVAMTGYTIEMRIWTGSAVNFNTIILSVSLTTKKRQKSQRNSWMEQLMLPVLQHPFEIPVLMANPNPERHLNGYHLLNGQLRQNHLSTRSQAFIVNQAHWVRFIDFFGLRLTIMQTYLISLKSRRYYNGLTS